MDLIDLGKFETIVKQTGNRRLVFSKYLQLFLQKKVIILIIYWLLSCVLYACRKTCLLGFLSGIETLNMIGPNILTVQPYILTYRLSQDHLELFFNAVRKAGNTFHTISRQICIVL